MADGLKPTEDLVMEVLAARYRLGEGLWTFDSRHTKTIDGLVDKGLAVKMHGITENTVRASLTTQGIKEWTSDRYTAPVLHEADLLLRRALEIGDTAGRHSESFANAIRALRKHLRPDLDIYSY